MLQSFEGIELVPVPPLSIRLGQELVETKSALADGGIKKRSYVEEELFSLSCSISGDGVVLVPMEFSIKLDCPSADPLVRSCELLRFEAPVDGKSLVQNGNGDLPISNGGDLPLQKDALLLETQYFSELLSYLIDRDDDDEMDK